MSLQDRWFVAGTTGTGKTTWAKALISSVSPAYPECPIYILDSKAQGDFKEWYAGLVQDDVPPPPIKKGFQVWQPGIDNVWAYDEWFAGILRADGPAIVLVDEISSLKRGGSNEAPPGFQRLMKQGRAAGKMIVNCTQEMAFNPRQIVTQTTHGVGFRMGGEYDIRTLNKFLGRESSAPVPKAQYGFFYRRMDRPMAVIEYSSYKDFF